MIKRCKKWLLIGLFVLGAESSLVPNPSLVPPVPPSLVISSPSTLSSSCDDVRFSADKCQYVIDHCHLENFGVINYLSFYYCSNANTDSGNGSKFISLFLILFWLCILFLTIGIAAYDFLCPNLSTIANILGLAESVIGVTFLAFGNGSPDMFSTYAAVRIGSGSLAVGELIGAATFIIAVVAGSMAVINPFRVSREPFLRDMTFFTVSVSFSLYFISDGLLQPWECCVMLLLYVGYGVMVVYWQMRHNRRKQQRITEEQGAIEEERAEQRAEQVEEPHIEGDGQHSPTSHLNHHQPHAHRPHLYVYNSNESLSIPSRRAASPISQMSITESIYEEEEEEEEENEVSEITRMMRINRRGHNYHTMSDENVNANDRSYRRLLSSHHSSRNSSPDSYFSRHSSHSRPRSRTPSRSPSRSRSNSLTYSRSPSPIPPVRSSLISAVEFHNMVSKISSNRQLDDGLAANQRAISYDRINPPRLSMRVLSAPYIPISPNVKKSIPSLLITEHDGEEEEEDSSPNTPLIRPKLSINTINTNMPVSAPVVPNARPPIGPVSAPLLAPVHPSLPPTPAQLVEEIEQLYNYKDELASENPEVFRVLFPSLATLSSKNWYNMISSILAVPSILILTCTVPVFECESTEDIKDILSPGPTDDAPEEADRDNDKRLIQSPYWLLIIQSILAPFAVAFCIFGQFTINLLLICGIASLLLLVILFLMPNKQSPIISYVGFAVVITWIATIASEVVAVLKALGIIFNVSEAILGLTVFAIGNSLGDLITDITLARLGFPTMALAACFGSPLLNILVGIGMSCLVVILGPTSKRPALGRGGSYSIEVSPTLVISGVTLLITSFFLLIAVPLNNWKMSRTIGMCTISLWVISTITTIVLEFV